MCVHVCDPSTDLQLKERGQRKERLRVEEATEKPVTLSDSRRMRLTVDRKHGGRNRNLSAWSEVGSGMGGRRPECC